MGAKNELGKRYGFLTVTEFAGNGAYGAARWKCVCDCGEARVIDGTGLRAGRNKSCGCKSPKFTSEQLTTHGLSKSRIYSIWQGMMYRCSDKCKDISRKNYYDKGIRVCERWHTFENFVADMGVPADDLTMDRIDNSKGYEPSNCRWATHKQQANNSSWNHILTYEGRSQTIAMWADERKIKPNTIVYRIRRKWPIAKALEFDTVKPISDGKASRSRQCEVCGTTFTPRATQVRLGHGKFCSQKCNGISRKLG